MPLAATTIVVAHLHNKAGQNGKAQGREGLEVLMLWAIIGTGGNSKVTRIVSDSGTTTDGAQRSDSTYSMGVRFGGGRGRLGARSA